MSDNVLQVMLIAFMFFLCALCLFAVIVIARDIVYESAKNRRDREKEDRLERLEAQERLKLYEAEPVIAHSEKPLDKPEETEKIEPMQEKADEATRVAKEKVEALVEVAATENVSEAEEAETEEADEGAVSFNRVNLTLEEKYATLSSEFKRFFDDIVRHAVAKDGVKEFKKSGSYDYKIGAYKVLKLNIKRGEIVCYFNFIDRDFNSYANESNVKIKQSATVVRVLEASAVGVVKDGVDLVCQQIAEDKERKRALVNEKRREKRRLQKEQQPAEGEVLHENSVLI